jgi:lambda family phage portal protein
MGIFGFLTRDKSPAAPRKTPRLHGRTYRAPRDPNGVGGWFPSASTVQRAPAALPVIRARARDLAHNNSYAGRAVSVLTSHAVGHGVRFSIRGDDRYRDAFAAWASSTDCDYEGRLNLYGIQAVAARTMFEAGDAFIIIRQSRVAAGLRPTLQLVDPDQIDEAAQPKYRGNRVISGVEVSKSGKVIGYHVRPELDVAASTFIAADQVIHLLEILHPGQLRGIPRGAQALVRANTIDSFLTAALAKARVEACFSAFVTTPANDDGALIGGEVDGEDAEWTVPEMLEPGMIVPLPEGYDVKMSVPTGSGGVRDYIEISLMSVAVAYGCTYAQVSGDVSRANYSSEKASRMEFNRAIDTVREHFIMPALQKIERAFRDAYEASESCDVRAIVSMTAPARESIEPAKDALADMTALAAGGMTFGQYCLSRGLDPDEQISALKAEREKLSSLGVALQFGSVRILELLAQAASTEDQQASSDTASPDPAA